MEIAPDKIELLCRHWLFDRLEDKELASLVRHARVEHVKGNQVIFRKGDPGLGVMAVIKGRVGISSTSPAGRELVLNTIEPGEVFGEISLLDGEARTANAIAMVATDLVVLDRRDFLPVLERSPNASRRLLQVLSSRLRRTSEQLEDAVFLVQSARLAKFVLRLARDNGRANGESVTIDLAFTQREIGAMVGVRREAINRQLTAWRDEGLIKMNGRRLSITSMSRFEAHAEDLIWRIPD